MLCDPISDVANGQQNFLHLGNKEVLESSWEAWATGAARQEET